MINQIKTITLRDKSLEGLAKKIEDYQNNSGLISKGSLPFFNQNTNEYGVIMFFPKSMPNTQQHQNLETHSRKESNDVGTHSGMENKDKNVEMTREVKPKTSGVNRQDGGLGKHNEDISQHANHPSGGFKPSEEQLVRWSNTKPSSGQLFKLQKLKCSKLPKTMLEAYELIKEYEKKSDFDSEGVYK